MHTSDLPNFFSPYLGRTEYDGYQIKLSVSIEKNQLIEYKNEFLVPTVYEQVKEAQFHIIMDVEHRLANTSYFRSPKKGYDLIRYSREASVSTYLTYQIIPIPLKKIESIKNKDHINDNEAS